MSHIHISVTDELASYIRRVSLREPEVLQRLRERTASVKEARMQITPEQGQFMQLLVQMLGAKKALEIGVFTGYSSLAVALALPPDGKLIACDVSAEWTSIGRPASMPAKFSRAPSRRTCPSSNRSSSSW